MSLPNTNYLPASFSSQDLESSTANSTPRLLSVPEPGNMAPNKLGENIQICSETLTRFLNTVPEDVLYEAMERQLEARVGQGYRLEVPGKINKYSRARSGKAAGDTPSPNSTKDGLVFYCGFCKENGVSISCQRKNDMKRHMEEFHHHVKQYRCPVPHCHRVYDWRNGFKNHMTKTDKRHKQVFSKDSDSEEFAITSSPPSVFACGFLGCSVVTEVDDPESSHATFKEHVKHIMRHYDQKIDIDSWRYSQRIRNLLQQKKLNGVQHSIDLGHLEWNLKETSVLRKRLETADIGDAAEMWQWVIQSAGINREDKEMEEIGVEELDETVLPMHFLPSAPSPTTEDSQTTGNTKTNNTHRTQSPTTEESQTTVNAKANNAHRPQKANSRKAVKTRQRVQKSQDSAASSQTTRPVSTNAPQSQYGEAIAMPQGQYGHVNAPQGQYGDASAVPQGQYGVWPSFYNHAASTSAQVQYEPSSSGHTSPMVTPPGIVMGTHVPSPAAYHSGDQMTPPTPIADAVNRFQTGPPEMFMGAQPGHQVDPQLYGGTTMQNGSQNDPTMFGSESFSLFDMNSALAQ